MQTMARRALILGVAAVLAGCGGTAASQTGPAPTDAPSAAPAVLPSVSPGSTQLASEVANASSPALEPGPLEPGVPYSFDLPVPVTFSVPAGWTYVGSSQDASFIANTGQTAIFSWLVADNLYRDPCHWGKGVLDPPVGPSVDDLVGALEKMPGFRSTGPTSETIGGVPAQRLAVTQTIRSADCDGGQMKVWSWEPSGISHDLYGGPITIHVLSVGGRRLVVFDWTSTASDAAATSAIAAIERSVEFR